MDDNRILVLSGPTASGKTAIALSLARAFPLEIVSADSMQVYRGMDIGTAKPTPAQRAEVPHHLVDVADPDEKFSAGRFVAEAEEAIRGIRKKGRLPLVAR
ncbi:MAG: tRNA (adenosine(37)-N6)-dimethylallyltransferase MiaA, partial [Deltaproteobacteria bacterium]|nr:tRNA (adenosine(37)-N6)-dimethylallyltransferase MiaA [Deltaproteobacteria bacterium]